MYLSFFLSLAAVLLYSLLAVFAVWRMNKEKQSAQLFALYAFGSALSELLVVLDRLGVIDFLSASFLHWLHPFGLIGLSLVFLLITAAFLRIGLRIRIWIGATLVWGLFVLSLITHFFGAVQEMILPEVWLRLAILLGWIWPFAAAAFLIYNTFRQVDQPARRRRQFWATV